MSQPFVLQATSETWQRAYRCANFLLREGAHIMAATSPFSAVTQSADRQQYDRGSFLVVQPPPGLLGQWHEAVQDRYGVALPAADRIDGFVGRRLHRLRIALYGSGGAPFNHARILAELGFDVDFVSAQEIRAGGLTEFDLFGMPGGGGIAMQGQLDPLGEDGCRSIAAFVRQGGMYLGSCAGSFDAALVSDKFIELCPQQRHLQLINAAVWNSGGSEWAGLESPGVGVLECQNAQPDHPIMLGIPERFHITHYNGPLFELQQGTLPEASDAIGLSAVTGTTGDFTPSEYFMRFGEYAGVTDDLLIARAAKAGCFNVVCGHNGLGQVVLFGSHPEFGFNLAMDKWEEPARMLANAAFWQGSHVAIDKPIARKPSPGTPRAYPPGTGLSRVSDRLPAIASAVDALRSKTKADAGWMSDALAMSTFGLSPWDIWQQNLAEFASVADAIATSLTQIRTCVDAINAETTTLRALESDAASSLAAKLDDALLGLEEAIHYDAPAAWQQDFGYEGVLQMLDRTETMLRRAEQNQGVDLKPSNNPYQHFYDSPFQLVVGSYLAAIGVFGNCWQLFEVHRHKLDERVFSARLRAG